jgi:dsDNA-specific endonuclease/ATPase MutS2
MTNHPNHPDQPDDPDDPDDLAEPGEPDPDDPDAAVELEITDVLDLHSFPPREVPDLVRDWLDAAYEAGYRELRIIHGRGVGVQRQTVRTLLGRDPRVAGFEDAPAGAGGWGATVVRLR